MKISLNWLSDFVDINTKDIAKIKDVITESTAEIDVVEEVGKELENIVVGKIETLRTHENADSLRICDTNIGNETVQIVCGGSNLEEGQLVAVAPPGAKVRWHGEGDLITLEKAKIRGEESHGMICASNEIGLGDMYPVKDDKEILDISHIQASPGTPLAQALDLQDSVLDVDNHAITHRADLFSHKGFAKEFVANGLGSRKEERPYGENLNIPETKLPLNIEFKDPGMLSRYVCVMVENISIKPSSSEMQKRLLACGIRPINNIVDISNYVMYELGTPIHMFDLDSITGNNIVFRKSKEGEILTTLDGVERKLPNDAIIMEDEAGIFDLVGIMGGQNSEIRENTSRIWIQFPVCDKVLVRRAMTYMGHRTDASTIFEKGVSPVFAKESILRALDLVIESCPEAQIISHIEDIQNYEAETQVIDVYHTSIERIAGVHFEHENVVKILEDLEFSVLQQHDDRYEIQVPLYRSDVEGEADVIEELVRIFGFNHIPASTPHGPLKIGGVPEEKKLASSVRNTLVEIGFSEVYTFSFLGEELIKKMKKIPDDSYLKIQNFLSEDISLMRQSLLPRLIETVVSNLRYQDEIQIFELSKVFSKVDEGVQEYSCLSGVCTGSLYDFRSLQSAVDTLLKNINIDYTVEEKNENLPDHIHPGRHAQIVVNGVSIGYIGQIHPEIIQNFQEDKEMYFFDFNFEKIIEAKRPLPIYKRLLKFPTITLDFSILIPEREYAGTFLHAIKNLDDALVYDVSIIDEYAGEHVPEGKRSITFSVTYAAEDKTLEEKEADASHKKVIRELEKLGGEVR